jgi:hypothetical protein
MIMIAELGSKATRVFFNDFIDEIIASSEERFMNPSNKTLKRIHKWTKKNAAQTRKLIGDKKSYPDQKEIRKNSLLYKLVY